MFDNFNQIDTKELELPDTIYSRDIESKVFQGIIFQALSKIQGVALLGGSFIDNLLGRDTQERYNGIQIEQDEKKHSINVRVELNIKYGESIPKKAEEIQNVIVAEVSKLTGLHIGKVHVVFKSLLSEFGKQEETIANKEREAILPEL